MCGLGCRLLHQTGIRSAVHIPPVLPLSSLHTASPLNILPWKNPWRRYHPSPTPHAKNTLPRRPPTSAAATPPNCLRLTFNTSSLSLKLVRIMCLTHFVIFCHITSLHLPVYLISFLLNFPPRHPKLKENSLSVLLPLSQRVCGPNQLTDSSDQWAA